MKERAGWVGVESQSRRRGEIARGAASRTFSLFLSFFLSFFAKIKSAALALPLTYSNSSSTIACASSNDGMVSIANMNGTPAGILCCALTKMSSLSL